MINIDKVLKELTNMYKDISDLYNHIILYTQEHYDELSYDDLSKIDKFMLTHANSISTRRSIYKFVPKKPNPNGKEAFFDTIL